MNDTSRNEIGSSIVRAVRDIFAHIHRELTRPSVLYRPNLTHDGKQWRVLYGENLHDGITGFGDTPEEAMRAFDQAWANTKTPLDQADHEHRNMGLVSTED